MLNHREVIVSSKRIRPVMCSVHANGWSTGTQDCLVFEGMLQRRDSRRRAAGADVLMVVTSKPTLYQSPRIRRLTGI